MFQISTTALDPAVLRGALRPGQAGAFVAFEGWVRDQNDGRAVVRLEYEAYGSLAEKEGAEIMAAARTRFDLVDASCAHRVGTLELGDLAVWVGVTARHRDAAFAGCRFIIDEVKRRVPIWKKEFYRDGDSGWLQPDGSPPTGK